MKVLGLLKVVKMKHRKTDIWIGRLVTNIDNIINKINKSDIIDYNVLRKDIQEQYKLISLVTKILDGKTFLVGMDHKIGDE